MTIRVQCGECFREYQVSEKFAGKKVKCKDCGATISIPAAAAADDFSVGDEFDDYDYGDQGGSIYDAPPPRSAPRAPRQPARQREAYSDYEPVSRRSRRSSSAEDEDLGVAEILLAILCTNLGCIFAIVWMVQGKPKGTKMLILTLVMHAVWGVVAFAVRGMNQPGMAP